MRKSIIISTIIGLILLSIACEKVIEIDLEDAKIRIVANSIIEPDSIIRVNVTRSRHILDNAAIIPLSDAIVKLYETDNYIGTLSYTSSGNYEMNYYPEVGKEYRIEVSHNDFDDVFSKTIIPPVVELNYIDTVKSFNENGYEIYNFYTNLTDPLGTNNYYYLSMKNRFKAEIYDQSIITYDTIYVGPDTTIVNIIYGGTYYEDIEESLYFSSDDLIFEGYHPGSNGQIFSDEIIDGKSYTLKTSVQHWSFYADTNTVIIELYAINKELYQYLISYSKHNDASGDPFAEPINVYTNIENGIGIFGGSSVYRDSIIITGNFGYNYWK
ncbi:MAG: DUF4249 domain-containing protein [Bacteroidales bacterium]|nr:DUF4249 domain-containing protein [Bacteroidales bacterium]